LNSAEIESVENIIDHPKEIFGEVLVYLGGKNRNIVYISCDTSLGSGAKPFKDAFPERHIEFGIQEQNAITQAAGLAFSGKIPIIGAHTPFIILKGIEQIRDDLCKTNANVTIVGRDFGLFHSTCGPTHTVLEDIGILRTLPNITIIAPSDGPEYRQALIAATEIDGPVYIRLSRHPVKRIHNNIYNFKAGKGNLLKTGSDITIIATSTMVSRALDATGILGNRGITSDVINMHTLKPIDKDLILKSSQKTKKVITIEEHSVINGLGSAVADVLIKENPVKMEMIGTDDCFAITGQTYEQLLEYYGFTVDKLACRIEDFLKRSAD
jgi:transketolase